VVAPAQPTARAHLARPQSARIPPGRPDRPSIPAQPAVPDLALPVSAARPVRARTMRPGRVRPGVATGRRHAVLTSVLGPVIGVLPVPAAPGHETVPVRGVVRVREVHRGRVAPPVIRVVARRVARTAVAPPIEASPPRAAIPAAVIDRRRPLDPPAAVVALTAITVPITAAVPIRAVTTDARRLRARPALSHSGPSNGPTPIAMRAPVPTSGDPDPVPLRRFGPSGLAGVQNVIREADRARRTRAASETTAVVRDRPVRTRGAGTGVRLPRVASSNPYPRSRHPTSRPAPISASSINRCAMNSVRCPSPTPRLWART
jgi:hypothetical protein